MKTALYILQIDLSLLVIGNFLISKRFLMLSVNKSKNLPAGRVAQRKRSAVIMLELILVLPILLFFLLAIVQIGMVLSNMKYVQLAALEGAKEASRLDKEDLADAAGIVKRRVDRVLRSAGLGRSCRIVLRQNVPDVTPKRQTRGNCECDTSNDPRLPRRPNGAVRVTVCVRLSQITPDMLSMFGFSLDGRLVQAQATLPFLK